MCYKVSLSGKMHFLYTAMPPGGRVIFKENIMIYNMLVEKGNTVDMDLRDRLTFYFFYYFCMVY